MAAKMTIPKGDPPLIGAGVLFVFILGVCLYWLFKAPGWSKDEFQTCMTLYDSVVKGTLLPLFIATASIRVGYAALSILLNKFPDK